MMELMTAPHSEPGREPLGPFALYILRPTWIGGRPESERRNDVVWTARGVNEVPIAALRDGFVIFEFDGAPAYAGGSVPAYTLPENRRVPDHVTKAENDRLNLGYRRFVYMNAFLAALYSAYSTIQKRGTLVQEPIDPTNYFGAERIPDGWKIFFDHGRRVDYPAERADILEVAALTHSVEVLQSFSNAIGADRSLSILSLVYIACAQYSRHQFSSAHLIAWSVVEALLNTLWLTLQGEVDVATGGHTKMNADRKKLLAGRDYTASVVSQILSIIGKVDDETLTRLDEARRKRNWFAHTLEPIGSTDAGNAIRLATDMISKVASIRMTSQLGLSFWI